jgi:hypothetical protein
LILYPHVHLPQRQDETIRQPGRGQGVSNPCPRISIRKDRHIFGCDRWALRSCRVPSTGERTMRRQKKNAARLGCPGVGIGPSPYPQPGVRRRTAHQFCERAESLAAEPDCRPTSARSSTPPKVYPGGSTKLCGRTEIASGGRSRLGKLVDIGSQSPPRCALALGADCQSGSGRRGKEDDLPSSSPPLLFEGKVGGR